MKAIIELIIELAGGVILLFAAGYTFARICGYDEYENKLLNNNEVDTDIMTKNNKDVDENDFIHHVFF